MADQTISVVEKAAREREATLKMLDDQTAEAKMYFEYWMGVANSGCDDRAVFKGGLNDERLTPDELKRDALRTAKLHIERHRSLYETRAHFARTGEFD